MSNTKKINMGYGFYPTVKNLLEEYDHELLQGDGIEFDNSNKLLDILKDIQKMKNHTLRIANRTYKKIDSEKMQLVNELRLRDFKLKEYNFFIEPDRMLYTSNYNPLKFNIDFFNTYTYYYSDGWIDIFLKSETESTINNIHFLFVPIRNMDKKGNITSELFVRDESHFIQSKKDIKLYGNNDKYTMHELINYMNTNIKDHMKEEQLTPKRIELYNTELKLLLLEAINKFNITIDDIKNYNSEVVTDG